MNWFTAQTNLMRSVNFVFVFFNWPFFLNSYFCGMHVATTIAPLVCSLHMSYLYELAGIRLASAIRYSMYCWTATGNQWSEEVAKLSLLSSIYTQSAYRRRQKKRYSILKCCVLSYRASICWLYHEGRYQQSNQARQQQSFLKVYLPLPLRHLWKQL